MLPQFQFHLKSYLWLSILLSRNPYPCALCGSGVRGNPCRSLRWPYLQTNALWLSEKSHVRSWNQQYWESRFVSVLWFKLWFCSTALLITGCEIPTQSAPEDRPDVLSSLHLFKPPEAVYHFPLSGHMAPVWEISWLVRPTLNASEVA